jgi:hypothetical protein
MKFKLLRIVCAGTACCFASTAMAGIYSDELGKCLVSSTTPEDRTSLIKWFFVAASHHPAVKPLSSLTPAQQDEADKAMGAMFMRLMTENCRGEAQKALQFEGPIAYQLGFQVLGQVAGRELMSNPEVTKSLSGLQKYVDPKKLKALSEGSGASTAPTPDK